MTALTTLQELNVPSLCLLNMDGCSLSKLRVVVVVLDGAELLNVTEYCHQLMLEFVLLSCYYCLK